MNTMVLSDSDWAFNDFRFRRAIHLIKQIKKFEPKMAIKLVTHAVRTGDKISAVEILSWLSVLPRDEGGLAVLLCQELERLILEEHTREAWNAIEIAKNRSRHNN